MEFGQPLIAVRIKDGIFVGNVTAAHDEDFLTMNKVTHIINCAGAEVRDLFEAQGTRYLTFPWKDTNSAVCSTVMFDSADRNVDNATRFIDEALETGDCVLIHSFFGVSRSCALCAAYLMSKYGWHVGNALNFVKMAHQDSEIKPYFLRQLRTFAKRREQDADVFDTEVDDGPFCLDNDQWMLRNTYVNGLTADQQDTNDLFGSLAPMVTKGTAAPPRSRKRIVFSDTKQGTGFHTQATLPLVPARDARPGVRPTSLVPIVTRRIPGNTRRLESPPEANAKGKQVLVHRAPPPAPESTPAAAPSASPAVPQPHAASLSVQLSALLDKTATQDLGPAARPSTNERPAAAALRPAAQERQAASVAEAIAAARAAATSGVATVAAQQADRGQPPPRREEAPAHRDPHQPMAQHMTQPHTAHRQPAGVHTTHRTAPATGTNSGGQSVTLRGRQAISASGGPVPAASAGVVPARKPAGSQFTAMGARRGSPLPIQRNGRPAAGPGALGAGPPPSASARGRLASPVDRTRQPAAGPRPGSPTARPVARPGPSTVTTAARQSSLRTSSPLRDATQPRAGSPVSQVRLGQRPGSPGPQPRTGSPMSRAAAPGTFGPPPPLRTGSPVNRRPAPGASPRANSPSGLAPRPQPVERSIRGNAFSVAPGGMAAAPRPTGASPANRRPASPMSRTTPGAPAATTMRPPPRTGSPLSRGPPPPSAGSRGGSPLGQRVSSPGRLADQYLSRPATGATAGYNRETLASSLRRGTR